MEGCYARAQASVWFRDREGPMGRLDGKVALITGGARGMGKSHVRHFVSEGARGVFGDVLDDRGAAGGAGGMARPRWRPWGAGGAGVFLGDVLDAGGAAVAAGLGEQSCRYVHHDVTSEADWATAVGTATDAFGALDVL